jgi:HPt (histidine-containing phosphotransfer) domain-containing protein
MLTRLDKLDKKSAISNILDTMWAKFLPDIRERVNVLELAVAAASAGKLDSALRASAQSAAHKLAGTLGTFGLQRGTELARELELRFARGGISVAEAIALGRVSAEIRELVEGRD